MTYRRMVKKKDLVKILYIYICFCHVCPGHPCGDNPLRNFMFIAQQTRRNLPFVLEALRSINAGAFKDLQREYQMYAECVGMVDTGYFKRSSSNEHYGYDPLSSKSEDESNLNDILRMKRKFENEIPR
ncbi:hypothetical protein KUTeg_009881 [Tegillarca granosa]|uniref:Uncharacterized protein n=1 Tax=Tegillarca granosa TaxID=220873 RepID=A0ABQ9FA48_TEGGR|nr:hypothetical protein KUTeg_009881 [Tegillarca granosa]